MFENYVAVSKETDKSATLICNIQHLRPERWLHVKPEVHQSQVQGPAIGLGQLEVQIQTGQRKD